MLRRLLTSLVLSLPVLFTLIGTSLASALTIGVTPGKMTFNVRPGSTESQTLYIFNQDDYTANYEVYIEGDYKNWVRISPDKFTLNALEKKSVEIILAPPITASPEEYNILICIVSLPGNSDLRVGAGVKVSTNVNITELPIMPFYWWVASAVILIALVIVIILVLWIRRARYG